MPPATDAADESEAEVVEVEPTPVLSSAIVRLHISSDEAMPAGAVAVVTLEGESGTFEREMPKGARLVRFDDLEVGRYDLRVAVNSAGVEIGTYAYFINLQETTGDVTVNVDYQRADLVVEAAIKTSMQRRYTGRANFDQAGCLRPDTEPGAEDAARLELALIADGEALNLNFSGAQGDTLTLSGQFDPDSSPLTARGTFESSYGVAGPWVLTHLSEPAPNAAAILVELENPAGSCQTTLEFAGLLENPPSLGVVKGSRDALATVEVLGHGQAQTVTLERDEPLARFEGMIIGPYDVLVEWGDGAGTVATHRESVVLGAEGARVGTTIEAEWPMPSAAPLATYGPLQLAQTSVGKSLVTAGAPECIGSIPLADSTTLTVTAEDEALALQFDNFYGRVLELSGTPVENAEALTASGTYRSSSDQTGTWTIDRFALPTASTVAFSVSFQNETDSCAADYLFAGVR